MINGKHGQGQGTHSTEMGADELAENTPKFVCPCPKISDFDEKRLHWASVIREVMDPIFWLLLGGDDRQQIVAGDIVCNMK